MSEFVLLRNNRVINRIVSEYPFAQERVLRGEADATVQLFGDNLAKVSLDWVYDPNTGVFTPPYDKMKPAKAKIQRKKDMAAYRYAAETAGIVVDGAFVRTDRESQALLTGAALSALDDPEYKIYWKAENGWVELTAPQIKVIARAVRAHVQACFDRERLRCTEIDNIDPSSPNASARIFDVVW